MCDLVGWGFWEWRSLLGQLGVNKGWMEMVGFKDRYEICQEYVVGNEQNLYMMGKLESFSIVCAREWMKNKNCT